ncbi:MAG: hypothetical protein EOM45_09365 [Clostridia bacterium]|nr:hypothetical protein [Clostridia bacterium]
MHRDDYPKVKKVYPLKIDLPEDFLNEEIRNNFKVSQFRKKIWAIELDLTSELLKVCNKYKLKVFAAYGTLLGAVRHNGFIPWDDDMDFFMLRDEYDKLLQIASEEFKYPYFLQTPMSDRLFFNGYARLRKSDTTGAVSFTDSPDFNNGIFIDIFVLDGIPSDSFLIKKQIKKTVFLTRLLSCYYSDINYLNSWRKRLVFPILKPILHLVISYEKLFTLYERNLKNFNHTASTLACLCVPADYSKPLPKYCFSDVEYTNYEFLRVPVPIQSDELLTVLYGDYLEMPSEEERGVWHEGIITFDPDTPYKEYYANRVSGKEKT